MGVVISLLRGVNLASHRRVRMDALRAVYESLGFEDVRTYLQSGNVVFRTAKASVPALARRLEDAIEQTFGFHSDVILRTPAEMRDVIARNPFANRQGIEPSRLLVTFLASEPGPEACAVVRNMPPAPEEVYIDGRELYVYYPNGMARPKISFVQLEKTLKTPATGRNWNTVMKLLELAESLQS
jgi:uncharacterized protein (DUF1697 family)